METKVNTTSGTALNGGKNGSVKSGHYFKKQTFHKLTYCHHCTDLLWGLTNQGMQCTVCGFVTHEKCKLQIVEHCRTKACELFQLPRVHHLIKNFSEKKRFCNVCRKRIDDLTSFSCQVCCYYVHGSCEKNINHTCKMQASYTSKTDKLAIKNFHHWNEGRLPPNSKCAVCLKRCESTDCINGFRCSWCLSTVHSFCAVRSYLHCGFGSLYDVVLPPYVVKKINSKIWSYQCVPSSSARTSVEDGQMTLVLNTNERIIRVYEGSVDNPSGWRNIRIDEDSTVAHVLADALQKFRINKEKTKYYLTRTRGSTEMQLDEHDKPWVFLQETKFNEPHLLLRHVKLGSKELEMTLYRGLINSIIPSITLKVNSAATAKEIIVQGLKRFQLEKENPAEYSITQVKQTPKRVRETVILDEDSIYEMLAEQERQTLEEWRSFQLYLQPKELPPEKISLYVENLPINLLQSQYRILLEELVGKWDSGMNVVAVFPNQGAVVILFNTVDVLLRVLHPLQAGVFGGEKLKLYILPDIKEGLIPIDVCPLIIFVNGKSGGGQGWKLLTLFKRLLNPYQVVDLSDVNPMYILYMFRNVSQFRVLICGGDGTFAWVLACLEDIRYHILKCKQPATALLPLGTGNDLARALNWGSGYSGESPLSVLNNVRSAREVMLDRWNIMFDTNVFPLVAGTTPQPPTILAMNNYFGIGIDAELCLQFHVSREENPDKFDSRLYNKGVYFKTGLKNIANKTMSNLQERVELKVDGKELALPPIEGLVILNISSWGAGSDPWGKGRDEKFAPSSFNDGLLEVVGFTSVYHMGKIKGGLASGIRIAQGSQLNIHLQENLPVQVDGEPWLQVACQIMIRPTLQQVKMLRK